MKFFCIALLLLLAASQTNTINWRDNGTLAGIDNMGTCRASWAFAATAMYESALLKWRTGYLNTTIDLAEQYILECSAGGDCNGGSVEIAMSYALANGIPNQTAYAYAGTSTLYGLPLTNTTGATCSSVSGSQNKVNTTIYLNKFSNIAFSQLQSLLSNFPAVGLVAANSDFTGYDGTQYPFNCTYNISADTQVNYAVVMFGYDSNSNVLIEASGIPAWGGSSYTNATSTGIGFGKLSSVKSYCGLLRHVYQYWTSSNNTNNTFTYYTFSSSMMGIGIAAAALLLMTI